MGGAAGHMAHPFDCREVRNGRDLINFYIKAVNAIPLYEEESKGSSVSVKLDGVNTSFRLQKANNPAGFMFVIDRGGKTPGTYTKYDFEGVTPDNVVQRFKGNKEHGMVQVVNHMSKILNHNLMELRPYVEALGIFERMGPDGVFFDAEYYANADDPEGLDAGRGYKPVKNNVTYNQNYIAIHRLSEFYTETKETRTGKTKSTRLTRGFYWETVAEINDLLKQKDELLAQRQDTVEIDQLIAAKNNELKARKQEHQEILDNLAKAIQKHSEELDMGFNVYTKIGVRFKQGLSRKMVLRKIDQALEMKVQYNYKKVNDEMSIGPTAINEQTGEVEGRKLKDLLLSIEQNPAHVAYYPDTPGFTQDGKPVKGKIQTKSGYRNKKDARQSAFALDIYEDVMMTGHETGIGPFDIGDSPRDAKAINSAVILWHAVRYIGGAIKDSIVADVDMGVEGGDKNHEGLVIQSTDICDGIAFKFTGEFIVDNRSGGFGVTPKGEDIPSDSAEALFETKIRYGELIESFMVEAEPAMGQKQQTVILLPGGFKPPTGGHYGMIKHYEQQSDVAKIIVVTGRKEREGVTYEQSQAIFNIYGGFSDKVEFLESKDPTPLLTCYELMKNDKFVSQHPNMAFSLGAGDKGKDPKRIQEFVKYYEQRPELTNANLVAHRPAPSCEVDACPASASRMRKAFREGDWELFKKLLPDDNFYDDVIQVLGGQTKDDKEEEDFLSMESLSSLVDEVIVERKSGITKQNTILEVKLNPEEKEKFDDYVNQAAIAMASVVPGDMSIEDKRSMVNIIKNQVEEFVKRKAKGPEDVSSELKKDLVGGSLEETSGMAGGAIALGTTKVGEDEEYGQV